MVSWTDAMISKRQPTNSKQKQNAGEGDRRKSVVTRPSLLFSDPVRYPERMLKDTSSHRMYYHYYEDLLM